MKKLLFFVIGMMGWVVVNSQNDRDIISFVIEKNFLYSIGDTFYVDVLNKKQKHEIILESINVMYIDSICYIDEFNKQNKYKYITINNPQDLNNFKDYELIYLNFKNINKNIPYQTQLIIKDKTASPKFEICYNIKSKSGDTKKLTYLRIFFE
ncbi:MAG: hypothetical protein WC996_08760 [Peptostreptococcales bacterium]